MIRLVRDNGDSVLINADQIVSVEPIFNGEKTRITLRNSYIDVKESVDEVAALIHGTPVAGVVLETKSGEDAEEAPDYSAMNKAELTAEALKMGLDVVGLGADTKTKLVELLTTGTVSQS